MSRYKQLATRFIQDIEAGKLNPGDRMLSLRQFARQHSVSISTAVSCYAELESQGWLIARPQSGFFITRHTHRTLPPDWQPFSSQPITPTVSRQRTLSPCGPLGTSRLQLDSQTQRALERSLRRAIKRAAEQITFYPEPQGESALRIALAEHFTLSGFPLSEHELVITHGCMDAVSHALQICTRPGDTVAVSSPCYNGLLDLLAQLSLRVLEIPSLPDGIDLDQFEAKLQQHEVQAGLFCTTHMNPQGITLSNVQKQRLAQLANQYQVPVIEDDVYFELPHASQASLPACYHDDGGYMLWCGSVSKTLSPSYRLGWCRPGRFFPAYNRRALGVPTLIQYALADFIASGAYATHLKRARQQLNQHKISYQNYLSQHLPSDSRMTQPDGGLVLWIQIPGLNTEALGQAAEQAGLDIRIGPWFTESDRYRDCLRINIGFALDEYIKQELQQLINLIEYHIE
ncbi:MULTISPECIES: aminotransferase-like domain-containing protein [Vibrio]|uniref:PLP-dependent aminotransferase family protein n=1 Tax=Vibrio ostreae TaxID=2841925 RepID=A0A975U809_9VIBR|nr:MULTISPECIES: PLP-dependent aminotransferase family protein [Vibrio]QXO15569.1 PLP-dependent aminotransferase family protein [Vibrio ostreae]WGY45520.1 PLP-dependent aminotransferase family protein [Vibrio sp. ABG19]